MCVCVILLFLAWSKSINSEAHQCLPAEENRVYEIHFSFHDELYFTDAIRIESPQGRVAYCEIKAMKCSNIMDTNMYRATIASPHNTTFVTLTVHNVTLARYTFPKGVWFSAGLVYKHEGNKICTPKIFYRPPKVKCQTAQTEAGYIVLCHSEKIYPRGRCGFIVIVNKTLINITTTSEQNDELPGNVTYFKTNCTLFVPKESLKPGKYYMSVTVYPTVHNETDDIQYGTKLMYSFALDNPSVYLDDCPTYVKEGVDVACTCKGTLSDPAHKFITWHDGKGNIVNTNQSGTLFYRITSNTSEFYCQARNIFGWNSEPVLYNINVVLRPNDLKCHHKLSSYGIFVICSSTGTQVYPLMKCNFILLFNESKITTNDILFEFEEIPGKPTYFTAKCSLFVPKSGLKPGNYNANVTMYPTLRSNETDAHFGGHCIYSFVLDCPVAVEAGTDVSCSCKRKYSNSMEHFIHWYDSKADAILSEPSHVLSIPARMLSKGHFCQAKNAWGWKSNPVHYKLNILIPASITSFQINRESTDTLQLNQGTSMTLECEADGRPFPDINLYNGQQLLTKTRCTTSPCVLDWTHNMTCESFNVFTCLAFQTFKHSNKSTTAYVDCPIKLTYPKGKSSHILETQIHENVTISIKIYGHPKPKIYTIIKNNAEKINFNYVRDGNGVANGYAINYYDDEIPYATINLTFGIVGNDSFAPYLLIIENGINPNLIYSFQTKEGSDRVKDNNTIDQRNLIISTVTVGGLIMVASAITLTLLLKKRATTNPINNRSSLISHLYEEVIYEDVDGKDDYKNIEANKGHISGTRHYDCVDEASPYEREYGDVVVRDLNYDRMETEMVAEYHKYNSVVDTHV